MMCYCFVQYVADCVWMQRVVELSAKMPVDCETCNSPLR